MHKSMIRVWVVVLAAVLLNTGLLRAQRLDLALEGEVQLMEQDLDARAHYKKLDQNDKLCAMIKVSVTNELKNPLVMHIGSMLAVVERQEQEDGEIWFWIPAQAKNLHFACEGYEQMPPIPVRLEGGKVYRLTLRSDAQIQTVTNVSASFNFLKLQILPEQAANALVSIGKTEAYETDVRYAEEGFYASPIPLNYGTYYYQVEHELFQTQRGTVVLSESADRPVITLKPAYGYLKITSEPAGAILTVDGKRVGTTPWTSAPLPGGKVQVRLQANDYALLDEMVEVVGDGTQQLHHFQLEAQFGTVTCTSEMADAEIWVDQQFRGIGTWTGTLSSQVSHVLEVRKAGHRSQSISFTVEKNKTQTQTIAAPVPLYGTLLLNTTPGNCQVWVDGQSIGTTPLVQNLLVGKHQLRVSKEGHEVSEFDVEIAHNTQLEKSWTLHPQQPESVVTGQFDWVTVEHNVTQDGKKGMKLLLDFSVQHMKGKKGQCSAYFSYKEGGKVLDKNQSYCTTDGQAAVGRGIEPSYDDSRYTDYELFIPYSELEVAVGKHNLEFYCIVWDKSGSTSKKIITSDSYAFALQKGSATGGQQDEGSTLDPITGTIKDITVEHNVVQDDKKGMKILVDFSLQNMRGTAGACAIYFCYDNGDKVMGVTEEYRVSNGQASIWEKINPRYDATIYTDFEMFIPYSELDVPGGRQNLKFRCRLWEKSTGAYESLTVTDFTPFVLDNGVGYAASGNEQKDDSQVTGKFDRVTVEHNVTQDGEKGMKLLLDFSVQHMKGKKGRCIAYFSYKDGGKVPDKNKSYYTTDGQASVGRDINPGYEDAYYTDYELFIPYSELEVSVGNHNLEFYCIVWDQSGSTSKKIITSDSYAFALQKGSATGGQQDEGSTLEPITGTIKDITMEHNVVQDDKKGMKILVDFSLQNMRGTDGVCAIYFCYDNGDKVMGVTEEYRVSDGQASIWEKINPRYDDTIYTDFEMFIPYSELNVPKGKHDLKFRCRIWEKSSGTYKTVDVSEYISFWIDK